MSQSYIREYGDDGGIYAQAGAEPGIALSELLDHTPPPVQVALELSSALADILAIAEEDGVAHGDPKIGLVRVSAQGLVALTDFRPGRKTTRAPEPTPAGSVSDIYGLGVILHSMLSQAPLGRLPKDPSEHDAAIQSKVEAYNLGPAESEDWVGELREFIQSMMAHSPQQRPNADEVADVLGNAAESLHGLRLNEWARQSVSTGASQETQAPREAENLEGVRTLHGLEEEPETLLTAPQQLQPPQDSSALLDESIDETVLDQPSASTILGGFQHEESLVEELPIEALPTEEEPGFHERETVIGTNMLRAAAEAEARARREAELAEEAKKYSQVADETIEAPPSKSPSGVIKGPALPPPPSQTRAVRSSSNTKRNAGIGLLILAGIASAGFIASSTKTDSTSASSPILPAVVPGPIQASTPPLETKPKAPSASMEASTDSPSPALTPEKTEAAEASETPKKVNRTAPPSAPVQSNPAPTPTPKPQASPARTRVQRQPRATPPPATSSTAPNTPYRVRIDIQGRERAIACGDGQKPEVMGRLNLTFESEQYCRIEIDGALGMLHVNDSGSFACSKLGDQAVCSKVR